MKCLKLLNLYFVTCKHFQFERRYMFEEQNVINDFPPGTWINIKKYAGLAQKFYTRIKINNIENIIFIHNIIFHNVGNEFT